MSSRGPSRNMTEAVGKIVVDTRGNDHNPKTHIGRDELPANARILPPGSIYTHDLRRDRLNLHVDHTNKVTKAWLG